VDCHKDEATKFDESRGRWLCEACLFWHGLMAKIEAGKAEVARQSRELVETFSQPKDQLSEIHLDLLTTTDELRDRQDRIERMLEGVLVSMGFVFFVLAVVALSVWGGGR
jgi:hypothetical protein